MTPRQQEGLETAVHIGDFDVPREVTTDDIATALDLAPSTVRDPIRRAHANVLSGLLHAA